MNKQLLLWGTVKHSLMMLWHNRNTVTKISLIWLLILIPLSLWDMASSHGFQVKDAAAEPRLGLTSFLYLFANVVAFASVAVTWHRYVLLGGPDEEVTPFRLDEKTLKYFGHSLLLGLGLVLAMVLAILPSALLGAIGVLVTIPVMVILLAYWLRFSLRLPALALGRTSAEFSYSDALTASAGLTTSFAGVWLLQFAVGFAIMLAVLMPAFVLVLLGPIGVAISSVYTTVVTWFASLFGVSLLTTLYGILVEGRELEDE